MNRLFQSAIVSLFHPLAIGLLVFARVLTSSSSSNFHALRFAGFTQFDAVYTTTFACQQGFGFGTLGA
jgi:hypothetical protein